MQNWIRRFFRQQAPRSTGAEQDEVARSLRDGYRALIDRRLAEIAPALAKHIAAFDPSRLPPEAKELHFEVFTDSPGFEVRLFAYAADGTEALSAQKKAAYAESFEPHVDMDDPVDALNAALETLFPIAPQDAFDAFLLWEDGPTAPQVALVQPIDDVDTRPALRAFFRQATEGLAERFDGIVTAGRHDHERDFLAQR